MPTLMITKRRQFFGITDVSLFLSANLDEFAGNLGFLLVFHAEDAGGDVHDAGFVFVHLVVEVAVLEGGGAREEHAQLAVVELETDFGELSRQRSDGLQRRTPGGIEECAAFIEQGFGDIRLIGVVEVPLGAPGGTLAVGLLPAIGDGVFGFSGRAHFGK